VPKIMKIG